MDMIASETEREQIAQEVAGGEKSGGCHQVGSSFGIMCNGWDEGFANDNYPPHPGGAIVLDGIGYTERYMNKHPEEFVAYSD